MSFEEIVRTDAPEAPSAAPRKAFSLQLRRPATPVVGLMPSVSLLPRELRDAERRKGLQRAAVLALVAVVAVTGVGIAGATLAAGGAQARLAAETERTQTLSTQVLKFADVSKLERQIAVGNAAVRVGSSTAIDWQKQLNAITADMPAGYIVKTVNADGATPIADYAQGAGPLDVPRAATVTMTIDTASIDELPLWLRELRSMPAYGDATPAISTGGSAGFSILLTLHLSPKALISPIAKGLTK